MKTLKPRTRDRLILWTFIFILANLVLDGLILYALFHLQPTIIVDTITFLDKIWPF